MENYIVKQKILKVSRQLQGKSYVPGVRIAGKYLNDFNFKLDDVVLVNCSQNKIIIKKTTKSELLKRMTDKNPSIISLINMLDLEL